MKVRVLRPALEDLAAGRKFYDRQSEGVGVYLFDSLFAEIDSLVLYAGIHRTQFGYHRLLAKRFPFAIYYRIEGSEAGSPRARLSQRSQRDSACTSKNGLTLNLWSSASQQPTQDSC